MNIVPQTKSLAQRHHDIGYALFMGGHPLSTCQNAQQIAGWWAALDAAAYADTSAYLSKAGVR